MRVLWRIIATIFKWTWRMLNFVREFVLNLFLILLIVVALGLWFQLHNAGTPAATQKGALVVNLSGAVVDKPSVSNKFSKIGRQLLGASSGRLKENSLFDVVDAIRQAKDDTNITGMVLDLRHFAGGDQPSLQYIGKALREFRDGGKPIFATGESYSQAQYYLASFANKIYLSPQGNVDLHGFATNRLYYKTLIDKLKISSHVFRVGTYKSAVEPFLRDSMSPEARDADGRWVGELWQNYLNMLAANRQITVVQVFPGAQGVLNGLQKLGGDTAQYAKENKLVDELASSSRVEHELVKTFGWDKGTNHYRGTSIYDYQVKANGSSDGNVAVILANGAIMDGEEAPGSVGADTTALEIRAARLDPKIKAIVFRVNSPGGSVTASETIREELAAAKEAGKPVVVSMGGMAASGGYWVSTPANYIIASPNTLTGSIGIFGVINTVESSLDAIGVHTDGVATSPLADVASTKALPPEVQQMMQLSIDKGYQNFIGLVAKSRNKTSEEIDKIAQGHVWTGSDAKAKGLIDALGDFDDAVAKAAELAKLDKPQLSWYQGEPGLLDMLFSQVDVSAHAALPATLKAYLPAPMFDVISAMKKQPGLMDNLNDPQNRYAFCLTCGEVK
ncbi:signal peptide peptidase SppA [Erwinia pyrifoliae]|uniref:signal peptide peptidase SppA n=1 Tax=Erwinia pyrifoliae TaxID=79967 RepID=UPI0001960B20|nr:signal peptide peptidase SppA [Erwinia pyrifoliae]AUX72870.1 signal peptide peptidase SppA [Erwinia pyrifoliae]MCA8876860.1 signal peptide peptidase SppA [Erwinia pyrifoliae]MCT2387018.1 signal peptide peptidase SppA [Erwinia pyrifoliae]MCU8587383.1 signal peptide peptidase SppA [Erwinia pyrifoliae]UXK10813.1 signal peptide peptidase SppA [Erwinia pyrifoliae]